MENLTNMPEPFFSVKGLKKSWGNVTVLDGIDLSLEEKGVLALIGPSGAGKTTLLRALDFLERPDAGEMTLHGKTLHLEHAKGRDVEHMRRRMSFVFQNFNLFLNRTALENVAIPLIYAQGMPRTEAEKRARALLEKVGMAGHEGKYPSELSGGQQQRVAIARALAPDPDLMLLDEPTSALDPERTREMLELLRVLAGEGRTMIIVTHELGFAARVSTRTAFLEGGKIVEEGPTEQIFRTPNSPRTRAFLAGMNALESLGTPESKEQQSSTTLEASSF